MTDEQLMLILSETSERFRWCIRAADGDWLKFQCLGAAFLIHPGADVARFN